MSQIKLSIIVPFYNDEKSIESCIKSLLNLTFNKLDVQKPLEIIFVDDGSTDQGPKIVQQYDQIKLIQQPNRGCAAARNTGIRNANGDFLLFTDSDCIVDCFWAETLVTPLIDSKISGSKGTYITSQQRPTPRFVQIEYQQKYKYMRKFKYIDFIDTYSAAYSRRVFNEGLFDESLRIASDQEFSFRMASKGFLFQFCPDAVVQHLHVESVKGFIKKKFRIGFWKVKILLENIEKAKGDSHTPRSLKFQVALIPIMLFSLFLAFLNIHFSFILLLFSSLLFLFSLTPLMTEAKQSDPKLFLLVPFYVFLRALSLGTGLVFGFIYFKMFRPKSSNV